MVVAQAVAAVAVGLLGASGIAKLADPEPTTGAMRTARLPSSNLLSYTLGTAEIVVAVGALAFGGPFMALGGVLYAAFAVFTFAALRKRIPVQSCGCFGRDDTPPTVIHVVFNVLASVALFSSTMLDVGPINWSMPFPELALYVVYIAIGIYASFLVLSRLPQLTALTRR